MSRDASLIRPFADGDYSFRLGWGELEMLQESLDTGPYVVLTRLLHGTWLVRDISEAIRIGLIGGGMEPIKALKMTRTYVEDRAPYENIVLAQEILGAAITGAKDEEVGKDEAVNQTEESENSPTES